jgi:hypothetical protein
MIWLLRSDHESHVLVVLFQPEYGTSETSAFFGPGVFCRDQANPLAMRTRSAVEAEPLGLSGIPPFFRPLSLHSDRPAGYNSAYSDYDHSGEATTLFAIR